MNAILNFTVENFRSISERKTISFIPDAIKDEPKTNVCELSGYKYLRTVALYGANSSGKSNLVKAMGYMSAIVVKSVKVNDKEKLPYYPFKLNRTNAQKPTFFAMDFISDGKRYNYYFSNTDKKIVDEGLIMFGPKNEEKPLFLRTEEGIGIDEGLFAEGKDLESRTNDNRLFISLVGQLGGKISNSIINFFDEKFNILSGLDTEDYSKFTKVMLHKQLPGCDEMNAFFMRMKLGFSQLSTIEHQFDVNELPDDMPSELKDSIAKELNGKSQLRVFSTHKIYDENGVISGSDSFNFNDMESSGTQKLFDMAGPIFQTLKEGNILVVDELDAKMHPLISREIVSLFNDPTRNPYRAQLIFTTHDTNLLSSGLLRRDQIWFTEKDMQERTDIYCMRQIILPDGTKPRGDGNIERNYIKGRYGAIPYIQPIDE